MDAASIYMIMKKVCWNLSKIL